MAIRRTLTCFCTFLVILMAILLPFIQASPPPRFQGVGVVTQDKTTQLVDEDPVTNLLKRLGRGTATFSFDSARKVPTGPDPLHHNNFPLRP